MSKFRPEQLEVTTGVSDNDTVSTKGYVDDSIPSVSSLFVAQLSADASNVTGDSTQYTVIFNTEIKDVGSDYNNASGIFTAPSDGTYLFNLVLQLTNLTAAHTGGVLTYNISAGQIRTSELNFGASRSANSDRYVFTDTLIAELSTSNTVSIQIEVSGSTLTVGVGGTDPRKSFFSGYKVS